MFNFLIIVYETIINTFTQLDSSNTCTTAHLKNNDDHIITINDDIIPYASLTTHFTPPHPIACLRSVAEEVPQQNSTMLLTSMYDIKLNESNLVQEYYNVQPSTTYDGWEIVNDV
jgi:hypothetical protein